MAITVDFLPVLPHAIHFGPVMNVTSDSVATRASRACQRCNQRKVKCDAVLGNGPCSRCRMDGIAQGCLLTPSRRGAYDRSKKRPRLHSPSQSESTPCKAPSSRGDAEAQPQLDTGLSPANDSNHSPLGNDPPVDPRLSPGGGVSLPHAEKYPMPMVGEAQLQTPWWPSGNHDPFHGTVSRALPQSVPSNVDNRGTEKSLASMFEDFLEKQGHSNDGSATKLGLILFGESSPLTFALEELNGDAKAHLYDAGSDLSKSKRLESPRPRAHPSHCSPEDVAYLEAKGTFLDPDPDLLDQLVSAFLDNFCPLYSIVNKDEVLKSHRARSLPWILLHAICFLGATFCDSAVIHKSNYKSRLHARRAFYDKAKLLFDVGYETDKVVLLQTVIMLSFWGPQMNSYWNPCSWVGFAVTIAASLGIHRSAAFARVTGRDKGLLKRLWWSLVVRDAYCAALLGRPFRIDMALCDTEMLEMADFRLEGESNDSALFQIQIAKLSVIVRKIVERRFLSGTQKVDINGLHELLDCWQAQVPPSIKWSTSTTAGSNKFATSLKILYHHHNILLHLGRPVSDMQDTEADHYTSPAFAAIAEPAAQMISSTAAALVTKQITNQLPHEVFAGFFVAGIVFYRQHRHSDTMQSQMARASLDLCQMLLNEVRDSWDSAPWALRIFDFLQSNSSASNASEDETSSKNCEQAISGSTALTYSNPVQLMPSCSNGSMQDDGGYLHPVDWSSPNLGLTGNFNDLLLMPNFYMPPLT